jgi:cysteine desulfurase
MLPKIKPSKKAIYLDYAATTPVDPRVKKAMEPFWSDYFGNPSSLYKKGREGTNAIAVARKTIADIIGARADEIIFTAGGTESINLAIFGVARSYELSQKKKGHIIASSIEHHAVLHSLDALKQEGWEITLLDVDEFGFVKFEDLKKALRDNTVLVSIMYANNEIGTIEPIAKIGHWVQSQNVERKAHNLNPVYFHTDACQAAGTLDIHVQKLGVDLMTVNGSKMYGPKQVGFLYVKSGTRLKPLIYGGGQEKNLRSGTENVPGIVGLAEALKLSQKEKDKENKRLIKLRDYFITKLFQQVPKIVLNGPDDRIKKENKHPKTMGITRLPNNINVSILDIEREALLLYLDSYNIAMSTGSACTSTSLDPSHVILAIGRPYEYAHGSMRFTLGKSTTKQDIDYVMKVLPGIVEELRRISPVVLDKKNPTAITMEKAFVGENMKKFTNSKLKS